MGEEKEGRRDCNEVWIEWTVPKSAEAVPWQELLDQAYFARLGLSENT